MSEATTTEHSRCKICEQVNETPSELGFCPRCAQRYGSMCAKYAQATRARLQDLGWQVNLAACPEERDSVFAIKCRKGAVVVLSKVDKIPFLAVLSRLAVNARTVKRDKDSTARRKKKAQKH